MDSQPSAPELPPAQPAGYPKAWWRELLDTILPALAIVLVINLFLAQPRTVHGQSMEPNLHENERVILDLLSHRFREPRRGEIIVIELPERHTDPLIKRVIGLPGEMVEIKGGSVYIDGQPLVEPYLNQSTLGNMAPQIVPEEHVFVLGDNRGASNDSRYFGMVPYSHIIGRAWLRYWPPAEIGLVR